MMPILWQLFVLAACLAGLFAGYVLMIRLIRTVFSFMDDLIEMAVALFFFLVIVPPLWIWHKARRPMWRTLSAEQTQELRAWLLPKGRP